MGQQAMGGQGGGSTPGKDTYMRNPPGGTIPHAQAMPPGYGSMQTQDSGGGGNSFAALLQQLQMQHGGQAPGTGSMGVQQPGVDPRAAMGGGQMGGRGMPGPVGLGATQMAPRGAPGAGGDPRGLGGVQFQGGGPGVSSPQQMQTGGAGPQGMPGFMQNPQLRSMMGPAVNVQGMYGAMPGAQQNIASLMQHFGLGTQAPNAQ